MNVVSTERGSKWKKSHVNVVSNEQVSQKRGLKRTWSQMIVVSNEVVWNECCLKCRGLKWIGLNSHGTVSCMSSLMLYLQTDFRTNTNIFLIPCLIIRDIRGKYCLLDQWPILTIFRKSTNSHVPTFHINCEQVAVRCAEEKAGRRREGFAGSEGEQCYGKICVTSTGEMSKTAETPFTLYPHELFSCSTSRSVKVARRQPMTHLGVESGSTYSNERTCPAAPASESKHSLFARSRFARKHKQKLFLVNLTTEGEACFVKCITTTSFRTADFVAQPW